MSAQRSASRQRGQILPMVAIMAVVLVAIIGLAIDVGRIMVAKAELVRAVDAAALAGVLKLPNMSDVQAEVYAYMNENEPSATVEVPVSPAERQIQVVGHKQVNLTFMSVLTLLPGIDLTDPVTVSADAIAGFGSVVPVDVQLVMDDTGTMKSGCNSSQTDSDCPVKQARDASNAFVDMLLSSTGTNEGTQIGMNPFRGCYASERYNPPNPPASNQDASAGCVLFSEIVDLTSDPDPLHTDIDGLRADGGYPGTNLCLGLSEAMNYLDGPNAQPGALQYLVVLTDGDNRYSDGSQSNAGGNNPHPSGSAAPPVYPPPQWPNADSTPTHPCRVTGPAQNGTNYGSDYNSRVNNLDQRTYDLAEQIKANGVEIYVIRFASPSGDPPDTVLCDPDMVGQGSSRENANDQWDQNLSRCIATSTAGTNDHYFYAPTPDELPAIFKGIAAEIAFRLIK